MSTGSVWPLEGGRIMSLATKKLSVKSVQRLKLEDDSELRWKDKRKYHH